MRRTFQQKTKVLALRAENFSIFPVQSLKHLIFFVVLASLVGCKEKQDPAAAESVRLLKEIKAATTSTHRNGEAFLVLKTDVVLPVADMEVLGFKADFSVIFDSWQQECRSNLIAQSEKQLQDPRFQAKLANFDKEVSQLAAQTNDFARKFIVSRRALLTEREQKLQNEKRLKETNYDELLNLVSPLEVKMEDLAGTKERKRLEEATIAELEKAGYKFTYRTDTSWIFETTFDDAYGKDKPELGLFFVEKQQRLEGGTTIKTKWTFLRHVPEKFMNANGSGSIAHNYINWKQLASKSDEHKDTIEQMESEVANAILSWEQKHGVKKQRFDARLTAIRQELENTTRELKNLDLEPLPLNFKREMDKERDAINQSITRLSLAKEDAIREKRNEIGKAAKAHFEVEFTKLMVKESAFSTRTGSRGDFTVPADIAYLYGNRARETGEHLVWLVPVDQGAPTVRLSNSNSKEFAALMDYSLP